MQIQLSTAIGGAFYICQRILSSSLRSGRQATLRNIFLIILYNSISTLPYWGVDNYNSAFFAKVLYII